MMTETPSGQHVNYYWTDTEKKFIRDNYETMTDPEIAGVLGCNAAAVYQYRRNNKMGKRPIWTEAEEDKLAELWGNKSFRAISMELGRSPHAIRSKVAKMGLGPYLENGSYISLPEFMRVFKGNDLNTNQAVGWIKNRGLPVHYKRLGKLRVCVIYIDEFWTWAEQNMSHLNFARLEPLCFGKEPDWVDRKRKQDIRSGFFVQKNSRWSSEEDQRLTHMIQSQKYTYAEVSNALRRTVGAVKGRCKSLGLDKLPLKGRAKQWTDEDYEKLTNGIKLGLSLSVIARALERSEEAVEGRIFTTYMTSDMDKVRAMMGGGGWASGAPEIDVRRGIHISKYKTTVKKDLRRLDELLRMRINELSK